MLVSSFGYLNKNSGFINLVGMEAGNVQKPILNQSLISDGQNNQKSSVKSDKTENSLSKHIDIIA